jgi:hypothetical protein
VSSRRSTLKNDQEIQREIPINNGSFDSSQQVEEDKVTNVQLYSIMCLMLVFGTLNTVIMKMQDDVVVGTNPDGTPKTFNHPYF